jgi:predicted ribosome quality control (RQC) complex YloA/Tae2 family protein
VGRTARENERLLRQVVKGNDLWLHARDHPGAYVFIRALPGKSVPLESLVDAATLALLYSRGKASGRGDVYYTKVKYLRRPRQGKPGLVIPTQERNLHVLLEEARVQRLMATRGASY